MGLSTITVDLHQHPLTLLGPRAGQHVHEGLARGGKHPRKLQGAGAVPYIAQQNRPRLPQEGRHALGTHHGQDPGGMA
eukprot:10982201-Heterocapsa_arctica.AAC.1